MGTNGIFEEFAAVYDAIYSGKDYRQEAERVCAAVAKHKRSKGDTLLEVACGTGNFLVHLQERFACTGLDASPPMLRQAKRKVPDVSLHEGDMTTFRLQERFDVVVCLFSSIVYARTKSRLARTLRNFARHLRPGGVVLIEPFITPRDFVDGAPHLQIYEDEDLKIARSVVAKRRRKTAELEFHFLVAARNEAVRHFTETHALGLFEDRELRACMEAAGLKTRRLRQGLSPGRSLFLGLKA